MTTTVPTLTVTIPPGGARRMAQEVFIDSDVGAALAEAHQVGYLPDGLLLVTGSADAVGAVVWELAEQLRLVSQPGFSAGHRREMLQLTRAVYQALLNREVRDPGPPYLPASAGQARTWAVLALGYRGREAREAPTVDRTPKAGETLYVQRLVEFTDPITPLPSGTLYLGLAGGNIHGVPTLGGRMLCLVPVEVPAPTELVVELTRAIGQAHDLLQEHFAGPDQVYEPVALEAIALLAEAMTWPSAGDDVPDDAEVLATVRGLVGDALEPMAQAIRDEAERGAT